MSAKPELRITLWPELCPECGQALARKVLAHPELETFVCWCPERLTFARAMAGDIDGERGIIRWFVTSPVDESEASAMITRSGAENCINLDAPKVH